MGNVYLQTLTAIFPSPLLLCIPAFQLVNPNADTQPRHKRNERLSHYGKWRSFPKVPNLLQYVSNGNYYGRIKVGGKTIRESLSTDVWTKAKLKLHDFVKNHHQTNARVDAPLFREAVELFKQELASDSTLKPQSKQYRHWCLQKLDRSWPELFNLRLDEITEAASKEWAAKMQTKIACHYYNNLIGTLKQVIELGLKQHKEKTGEKLLRICLASYFCSNWRRRTFAAMTGLAS